MARDHKGPVAPPPPLKAPLSSVADTIAGWPGVITTVHWDLFDTTRVDGVDFYIGANELGHIHLDGELHLATSPALGKTMVGEGVARPFRYQRGWVCERVQRIGTNAAIALFERNYERLLQTR